MADGTKIEWADATLNYVNGCSLESPGCTNCYAMKQAHRVEVRRGLTMHTKGGMVWTGEVRENPKALDQALAWRRGRAIFWNAHGDLFHPSVPDEWIDRQFAVCALTPQHRHMILTKRSARMRTYMGELMRGQRAILGKMALEADISMDAARALLLTSDGQNRLLPNVWIGVSVEDQQRADERIPDLLATPAAIRFISAEPLLGPVDMRWALNGPLDIAEGFLRRGQFSPGLETLRPLDWVIAGGESGPGARPMHPDWARSLRDQCAADGVAFHFKQWGEWMPLGWEHRDSKALITASGTVVGKALADLNRDVPGQGLIEIARVGKKAAGRLLDGRTHDEVPSHA